MEKAQTGAKFQGVLPALPCTCANLRRAARAVSRLYNGVLQPHGIEITQLTLLMTLDRVGEISQGNLGRLLALDSTTLTRVLQPLRKRGWIHEEAGSDRRFRIIRLTPSGQAKYQQCLPHWRRAQDRLRAKVGDEAAEQLGSLLAQVAALVGEG